MSESFVGLRPLHIIDNAIDANAVSQILDKHVVFLIETHETSVNVNT